MTPAARFTAGTNALGFTSGGGNSTSDGTTFFQPARAAVTRFGVTIY